MLALILVAVLSPSAHAVDRATEVVKFLTASSTTSTPLEGLLKGEATAFVAPVHNLKISIVFEKAQPIARLKFESCGGDWQDGIQVFTSPGLTRVFNEGGKSQLDVKMTAPQTRSVALVFGKDAQVCLKNLMFFDAKNQTIAVEAPTTIETSLSDSNAAALFDQRPETRIALEDPLTLTFATPQKFDRAVVWTGGSALYAHSLKLKGDKGWSETLPLRHATSDQEVIFKKPFAGKKMTITAADAGEVGEFRFALGTKVQGLRVSKKAFSTFANVLDSSWVTDANLDDRWTFLFRGDGTFFVKGVNDDEKQSRNYAALGAYTIARQTKDELKVKINGVRFATSLKWDGVMCPFSCGNEGAGDTPLTDTLVFELGSDGTMIVRSRTSRSQRTLTFSDLKLHHSVDD